jgi:hypothetical protein
MSAHESRWAWLTKLPAGSARSDDGRVRVPSAPHEGGPRFQIWRALNVIADVAGWSMIVPFDLEDAEHRADLEVVANHVVAEVAFVRRVLDDYTRERGPR